MTEPLPVPAPTIGVNLRIPTAQVPRIVAALRGAFPGLTSGKTDLESFAVVLRFWLASSVATYEIGQERPARDAEITALVEAIQADMAAHRDEVEANLSGITVGA